jgi:hypothetical protein
VTVSIERSIDVLDCKQRLELWRRHCGENGWVVVVVRGGRHVVLVVDESGVVVVVVNGGR